MARKSSEVAIFWDFGSCPAPAGSQPSGYTIVRSIRTLALRLGVIKSFRAYLPLSPANGSTVPALALRSELQSSGVSLTDAAGGKDVADKMLLVDMLAYAFDRPSSSASGDNEEESCPTPTFVLITADPSFAYGLSILRMRNYRIALMTPTGNARSLGLISQADFCLEWPWDTAGVAKGGSIPPTAGSSGAERSHDPLINSRQSADLEDAMNASSKPSSAYPGHNKSPAEIRISALPPITTEEVAEHVDTPRNSVWHSQQPGFSDGSIAQLPLPTEDQRSSAETGAKAQSDQGGSLNSTLDTSTVETPAGSPSPSNVQSGIQMPEGEEPPSYSQSHTPLQPSSKPNTPPVEGIRRRPPPPPPPEFSLLVELLRSWRTKGEERPLRGTIAVEIVARDRLVYQKAGTTRFAQYTLKAQNLGIIELGGWMATAWISLHPAYH